MLMTIGERSLCLIKLITVLLYWLIIAPIGMVRQLIGIRDLDFRWKDGSVTYWDQCRNTLPVGQRVPRR